MFYVLPVGVINDDSDNYGELYLIVKNSRSRWNSS